MILTTKSTGKVSEVTTCNFKLEINVVIDNVYILGKPIGIIFKVVRE